MIKFKTIYVILVYRNIDVLKSFYSTFKEQNSHTIVVNSFYDDESLKECESVAIKNGADFISIPNKGFSYGNNIGVKFVLEHYNFDFLILSNSDIIIKDIKYLDNLGDKPAVYAPRIRMTNGKDQNPNIPWFFMKFLRLQKKWAITHNKFDLKKAYIISRGTRELFLIYTTLCCGKLHRIYSAHGSFIIFSKKAVDKLYPFFNDAMFLYNEESYLGLKCIINNVPIFYCPQIDILHLEGASSSNVANTAFRDSALVLFEWMRHQGFKI